MVQAPREHAALPVQGHNPAVGFGGLHVVLVPVVRAHGRLAGLPCPDLAVRAGDDGLVAVAGNPVGSHVFRKADSCETGGAIGKVPGLPVRVQEEESLVEGLGLENANARVLPDAFGLGFPGVARLPGPGLPFRVQGEDPAVGGYCGDGLRLPGQAGRSLFGGFRVQVLATCQTGSEGVDLSLPVHGQQPVIVGADAGELAVADGVEDDGRRLLAGPGVYVLVGSQSGLQSAAGCGLQVVESLG